MAGRVQVRVDVRALKRLRDNAGEVLKALDIPLRDTVRYALDVSQFLVPVESGGLRESAFLDGPRYNFGAPLSSSWSAGFAHPAAGAIHEGFHWGLQSTAPPFFLKRAFRGSRGRARKGVAAALERWLKNHLSRI